MPDTPPPFEHVALEISLGNDLAAELEVQLAEARARVRKLAGLIARLKAAEPVRLTDEPDEGDEGEPAGLPVKTLLKQLQEQAAERAARDINPGKDEDEPTGSDGS